MSIGIHIVTDNLNSVLLERSLLYLSRVKPSHSVFAGGAAFDLTMQAVERSRSIAPSVVPIVRKLEDTGCWLKLTPQQWFDDRVAPRLDWCRKNGVVWLLDNETSGNDDLMRKYAAWNVEVMQRLHMVGLNAAVLAFATGNPQESQYALFKPVFDAMTPGDVFASHEYLNSPNKSSGGNVFRYNLAWQAAGHSLPTVITEFGIAADYNPGHGWQTLGMSAKDYAAYIVQFYEAWYKTHGVTVCLFCVGGYGNWSSFQLNADVFTALEAYAASQPPSVPPTTAPPIVAPPTPPPAADANSIKRLAILNVIQAQVNELIKLG